jgi:hypothetical protein
LKVYRTQSESGAVSQAFIVEWKGADVVVRDMFGKSTKGPGDTITVMMSEIEIPDESKKIKVLQFVCMDSLH